MTIRELKNSDRSIRSQVKTVGVEEAICEYIWNGIDADATEIDISTEVNDINGVDSITILDNGSGIAYDDLNQTFGVFLDSKKDSTCTPITRGKRGRGRFTFCKFCKQATWKTWSAGRVFELSIHAGNLNHYDPTGHSDINRQDCGTEVLFKQIDFDSDYFVNTIMPYIEKEFSWLILSNPNLKFTINNSLISLTDHYSKAYCEEYNDASFAINSIFWKKKQNSEDSFVYFINSDNTIVHKDFSKLNKKKFYCSAYVKSPWFDGFTVNPDFLNDDKNTESDCFLHVFNLAKNKLRHEYLNLRKSEADRLIDSYERDGIFPEYKGDNKALSEFQREQLISTIKTIYEAEPAVFRGSLNKQQKKIFVKLIDKIVQSNNISALFDVLEGVVSLSEEDMSKLANTLKRSSLENIVRTIEHIKERCDVLTYFKSLIYDHTKFALEVPHIQKCIEQNLWILGEQYHLLTAEEDKFDTALRSLLKFRGAEHYDKHSIDHPHKNKEMDIFAAQQGVCVADDGSQYFHNVVIELKRPSIKLRDEELIQIQQYRNIIAGTPEFNDPSSQWDFILIGNEISQSPITAATLQAQIESSKPHGEHGLVQKTPNTRIYVKSWSQILNEFEIRYKKLTEKLKLQEIELVDSSPESLTQSIVETNQMDDAFA